jgi:hypothetical protein
MVTEDIGITTGIWLVAIILIAVIGGLYLLSRYLRNKALEEIKQFRAKWRRFQSHRREVEQSARSFSTDEPEPYRSRLKNLFTQLDQMNRQADHLERQYVILQQCASNLASRRWRTVLGAPLLWYLLHRDISHATKELEKTERTLDVASQVEQTMNQLGWEVAQQVKDTLEFQSKLRQSMDFLRERKLQGEEFENITRLEEQTRIALAQIPAYFSTGEEGEVLSKADTGSIALAHQTLDSVRPALARLLAQAQAWEKGYTETAEKVASMRGLLDNLERTFESLPSSLDVDPYRKQWDQLCVISKSLQGTLERMEIESMTLVAQEAVRTAQVAQEAGNRLKRARREVEILDDLLKGLSNGSKKLSLQLSVLGAQTVHPVAWSQSKEALNELNRKTDQLAAENAPAVGQNRRTPDDVSQNLSLATQLSSQQKNLRRQISHIEETHRELLDLLASKELSQLSDWLQNARLLVKQASAYAPDNWGRNDAIAELPSEMETLAGAADRLILFNRSAPIPEAGIDARLNETRQLAETSRKLQERVEKTKSRLAGIKNVEELTRGRLEGAQSALNQIAAIFRGNPFLSDLAGQEVNRLLDQIQKSLDELFQSQRGAVEKKARQAAALVARIEQSANQWLDRLNQQIRIAVRDLSASLAELDAIAQVDEAPLEQARRLVSSSLSPGAEEHPGKPRFGLGEAIGELKKRSDYWQTCATATQALQEVRDSIFPVYQEACRLREQVQNALKGATSRARRMRNAWPPSFTTSDLEMQELEKLEEQWKALKASRVKAASLAAHLDKLSSRYRNLSERIDQNAARVSQEQLQVEKLELEIHDMAQYWENLMNAYSGNPAVTQEIDELLNSIDREQAEIRKDHRQGDLTYDQALQDLKSLHNRVRHFQAALDEERALEYGGAIRSRR